MSNRIRARREELGMLLGELAEGAGVGRHDLAGYEAQEHQPPSAVRRRLAQVLGQPEAELFVMRRAPRPFIDDRVAMGRR